MAQTKDGPILAAALASRCGWLITFNTKHFHPPEGKIEVIRPEEFVELLRRMLEGLAET